MSRSSPYLRGLAKPLVAYESQASPAEPLVPAAFRVCEKLRSHLATFMGTAGYRELLLCALPRAKAEIPWLRAVRVKVDGALEMREEPQAHAEARQLFDGGVILVAELLGLLVAFIGKNLTLSIMREVWPEIPLADFHPLTKVNNENNL